MSITGIPISRLKYVVIPMPVVAMIGSGTLTHTVRGPVNEYLLLQAHPPNQYNFEDVYPVEDVKYLANSPKAYHLEIRARPISQENLDMWAEQIALGLKFLIESGYEIPQGTLTKDSKITFIQGIINLGVDVDKALAVAKKIKAIPAPAPAKTPTTPAPATP